MSSLLSPPPLLPKYNNPKLCTTVMLSRTGVESALTPSTHTATYSWFSCTSTGSRSTIYVPPMSTRMDIPDFRSDLSSNSRSTGRSQTASTIQSTIGHTYATTFGFHSHSSSTTSRSGSTLSYTDTKPMSSLLSPLLLLPKDEDSKLGATITSSHTAVESAFGPITQTTITFTSTLSPTQTTTGTRTFTGVDTPSYTVSATDTATNTPMSSLRRPQTSPRSPLASVRNIVALWKERTPASSRPFEDRISTSVTTSSASPQDGEGLSGIRRHVQRTGERLRDSGLCAGEQSRQTCEIGRGGDGAARNGDLPPGFDMGELSQYAQSNEAVS